MRWVLFSLDINFYEKGKSKGNFLMIIFSLINFSLTFLNTLDLYNFY